MAWGEILSAERLQRGRSLRLHTLAGEDVVLRAPRGGRRELERLLRDAGVTIVDEYGARIDQSQFEKEADPTFVPRSVAEYRRDVGQWSDSA